jgi:hypothetical protein
VQVGNICLTPKALNGEVFKTTTDKQIPATDLFHGIDQSSSSCSLSECKLKIETAPPLFIAYVDDYLNNLSGAGVTAVGDVSFTKSRYLPLDQI